MRRLLTGGHVRTLDGAGSVASAVAVDGDRIVAVGRDDEILALGGAREDLAGATVIPGLVDAHNHLQMTGRVLDQVQLFDCRSLAEIVERVAERCRQLAPGTWVLGRGWDESLLDERRHPTRHDLDPVSPDHPVLLERVWNKLTCNSAALAAAGVDRDTPDPGGTLYAGSFERDGDGHPTGLFRDRAKELVWRAVPEPTEVDWVTAVETACREYNRLGLTAVCEPGLFPQQIRAYQEAERQERLTVRVDMLMAGWGFGPAAYEEGLRERLEEVGAQAGFGGDRLRLGGVKLLPDGGIGDRTARIFEPYLADPGSRGTWVIDPDELPELVRFCHDHGWAIDTHTCGDEAQEVTVAAYAAAQEASPRPWLRHRVHHAYFPTERALELMARHRIGAATSNPFLVYLAESFVTSLGEERTSSVMPMRTYLERGVPLAGSSDTPVSDHNPWTGIYAACTRRTELGRELDPAQRLTVDEALRSYTNTGAWMIGRDDLGSLEVGKRADLVVLDDDPYALPVDDLRHVVPARTMVAGAWV
jgi:predicted amidohydrolase YtcJ